MATALLRPTLPTIDSFATVILTIALLVTTVATARHDNPPTLQARLFTVGLSREHLVVTRVPVLANPGLMTECAKPVTHLQRALLGGTGGWGGWESCFDEAHFTFGFCNDILVVEVRVST